MPDDVLTPYRPTPAVFAGNPRGERRFWEFFTANIRNPNTRVAYLRAAIRFSGWCGARRIALDQAEPILIAAYVEELQRELSAPSVKQHLAALRMLFDWLVIGQALPYNPATSVRGPKFVVRRGKTPVLRSDEARDLLDSVPANSVVGLRDRALIGVMVYTFARVGAVVGMRVEDYFQNGKRWWFRLHEKGGKRHEVPAHHNAEAYVDAYLEAAGHAGEGKAPLFRSADGQGQLKTKPMRTGDVLRMIKRRTQAAGLPGTTCCHTFRATGITAFLENGGTLEQAQAIAAHESPRTTKLYDRSGDELTLDMIEKIAI